MRVSHSFEHPTHESEACYHTRHWIVRVNLVFQIYKTFILLRNQSLEYFADWHLTLAHRDLTLFTFEIREVLHMHVEKPWARFVDGLNHIRTGANRVSNVDTA